MSRKLLKELYFTSVNEVKAKALISQNIKLFDESIKIVDKSYSFERYKNIYVFSVGKASYLMAKECEQILKDKISGGLAICLEDKKLNYIETFQSTHPIVSRKSFKAAQKMIEKMQSLQKDDLVIFLLSGGASAMIEKPIDGLNFQEFEKVSTAVLKSGVDIKALNSVRKSISQIKGGKLANYTKAKCVNLVLSDVVGNDLSAIGSGLMYNEKVANYIIGSNKIALQKAKKSIEAKVKKAKIVTTVLNKDTSKAAQFIKETIEKYDKKFDSYALFFGGETTTEVKANGVGGRNQELALKLLINDAIKDKTTILCAGSDGIDGNSNSTGAFLDNKIYKKIQKLELNAQEYLENCDSNSFFKKLKYDFTIGKTGTNVMDFIFVLKNGGA
ncbi:hydroxypyruvate reductase [Arcobacter sp. CECT 8989]|uniref:glycerate kinase type-2 family protein n=1 Tax=Arcobacter sp. CECT 8989 TaxID=2044509 RepID=UPI00100A6E5E|nr:DUF4147 domain-containing protein [Arcobacter sp. CECT 8989]RXJ98996.1 hydroxypyruvate reductase [Arcobacter sp. CECT 8989]